MINYLRRNQQVFIFFIFIYAIITVTCLLIAEPYNNSLLRSVSPYSPFLSSLIEGQVGNSRIYSFFSVIIIILVLFLGFYLVRILINYLIIPNRTQFAALFFIAIASFAFQRNMFSGVVIGIIFLLFALDRAIGAINSKTSSYRYIDAGILLSVGSLFYIHILFLFPFLLLTQLTLRSNYRKESLYSLIGLLLPFLYIFSAYYIIGKPVSDEVTNICEWMQIDSKNTHSWGFVAGIGFYILMITVASLFALRKYSSTKIQVRKLYRIFFYLFINVLAIYFLLPSAGDEIFYLLAIPLSVLMSIYYAECKSNFMNNILLLLLICMPLAILFLT